LTIYQLHDAGLATRVHQLEDLSGFVDVLGRRPIAVRRALRQRRLNGRGAGELRIVDHQRHRAIGLLVLARGGVELGERALEIQITLGSDTRERCE